MTSETEVRTSPMADVVDTRRLPGEPGLWVFLFGDMVIFGIFFVTFLVERAKDPDLFGSSREALGLTIGLTNTMVLLTSSLLLVIALENVRRQCFRAAKLLFAAVIACGTLFTVLKAVEYIHMIGAGHGPEATPFYMWFFILTGIHLFHVVIGIVVVFVMMRKARSRAPANGPHRAVYEGGACYWHLVDLLWMILFPLVYLVA